MLNRLETFLHEWERIDRQGREALERDRFADPVFCRVYSEGMLFAQNGVSHLLSERPDLAMHLPVLESMFVAFRRELDEGRGRSASGYLGMISDQLVRLGLMPAPTTKTTGK